ncbi:MAG: hypothetical protein ACOYBJ_03210 [Patescibacteria group bacterium]|jgi:hypothetical protein
MSQLKRSVRLVAAAGILVGALGVLGWSVVQSVRTPAPTSAAVDGFDLTV